MKKQARVDDKVDKLTLDKIDEILDKETPTAAKIPTPSSMRRSRITRAFSGSSNEVSFATFRFQRV